ncbi:carbohydrate binding domain-containing protein [Paenibacillus hexagrammi]|uniref:Alpha amylase n=1 Tax=Paenibacillus hexagrammi TaxID=2908839 RepID=A0ABY3SLY5_9BACL|nr:carbohydrate binding domain-containing protein [Paenibacillus sp. YPD9-1]UJF34425.1 alpha amylase [Paenibacillus sp. YPD9-1]
MNKSLVRFPKWFTLLLCFTIVLGGMVSFSGKSQAAKLGFDENDTIYQIMVDRFNDGDPSNNATGSAIRYGETSDEDFRYMKGGDWQGVIDKLSYIKNMGYTAIWISPVAEPQMTNRDNNGTGKNTAYHGYNVKDPNKANPYFGTKEKLKELVDKAHEQGIKVIIDVVPNHVGDFLLGSNNYYDRADLQPAAPFNNPAWYHHNGDINFSSIDGNYTQAAQDYLENHDLGGLDDIDHDNPAAKQAIFDSIKYWFDYTGADAARVDAAKLIRPSVIHELEQYVGINSFGENFDGNAEFVSRWVGSNGEWGMLDFPLFFSVLNSFAYGQSFEANLKNTFAQDYRYNGSENHMVTFIDNHDRNRFLTEAGGNVQKLQNALAFIFTARGVPVVFQGTEQNKGNGNGQIMTGGIADTWNRWSMIKRDSSGNVLENYFNENTNTYQFVAKLNQIRQSYAALRTGKQREMWASANLYAMSRRIDSGSNQGQEVIGVFSNAGSTQTQTIPLRVESSLTVGTVLKNQLNLNDTVTVQSGGVTGKQITVTIDGNSSKIYAPPIVSNDTQPPSTPTGVAAQAPSAGSVQVSWTASTDNVGVTGYEVYRDGTKVATTAATSYTDSTGVQPNTTYSYTVKALDAAGNASALSAAALVTTPQGNSATIYYKQGFTTPYIHYRPVGGTWTTAPGVLMPAAEISGYNKITISLGAATQLEAVFNNGSGTWDNNNSNNYMFPSGVSTFQAGTITPGAPAGQDTQAPTVPAGLTAAAGSSTSAALSWTAATDNVGVTGYDVYRDGVKVASSTGVSYTDTALQPNTTYTYTVSAYDAAGNKSAQSQAVQVTTPEAPAGQTVTVYYKTGFTTPYMHYKIDGASTWTTSPGVAMQSSEYPGYSKLTIDVGTAAGLTAAFNNGSNTWDNNNGQNYHFNTGTSTLINGTVQSGVPQPDSVTFKVTVPANTPSGASIYLAGSLNSWNAADPSYKLTKNTDGTFSITLPISAGTAMQYKFTKGAWTSVETNANGSDIANRSLTTSGGAQTVTITVQRWKDQ